MNIKPIIWGECQSPNKSCCYDHIRGKSPLGDWLITWKNWKDSPSYDVDVPFEGEYLCGNSLDEAKDLAYKLLQNKILESIEIDVL